MSREALGAAFRPDRAVDAVFIDLVAQMDDGVHRLFQIGDGAIGVEIAEAVMGSGHHRQPRPLSIAARPVVAPSPAFRPP